MYLPKHFEQTDISALHGLIRARPLATLITLSANGLEANHIPLLLQPGADSQGSLQGHVPRASPLLSGLDHSVEALAVFHGPDAYITPAWYATKQETGKVVPTWNYRVLHVYGRLAVIDDPAWVRRQVTALTEQQEAAFEHPWQVSDAPREYTERMIAALVGIELEITRLLGKVKASQNQPQRNRVGVADGLRSLDDPHAAEFAGLIDLAE